MAIEKSLYAAPEGLPDLENMEPDLEIEIENPDSVTVGIPTGPDSDCSRWIACRLHVANGSGAEAGAMTG